MSCSYPSVPRVVPRPYLYLPPSPSPPPPPSLELLRPPAPSLELPPPSPSAEIARKDENVRDWTDGGETSWSTGGGSAPLRKCPSSPSPRGGGWHKPPPVHTLAPTVAPCALSASVLELTCSGGRACCGAGEVPGATAAPLDRLTDPFARWTTYLRTYTKPPIGVYPFLFCPLDDPVTVKYLDMPPAIARPSLIRSEITAVLSH